MRKKFQKSVLNVKVLMLSHLELELKIEEELKYIFPDIKTLRMDKDTTSKKVL